ncbi:MAG: hypothetical protein A3E85_00420 [Gammaproteobacteria bacterium RIFCSPHIGHO2_12_FULL_45_12]|nr:MAG: hypothetical protein A3E85_00420 [Gammaproteobacteria bacterium RIFCSPHIGHO2_12_FULL_45_12]
MQSSQQITKDDINAVVKRIITLECGDAMDNNREIETPEVVRARIVAQIEQLNPTQKQTFISLFKSPSLTLQDYKALIAHPEVLDNMAMLSKYIKYSQHAEFGPRDLYLLCVKKRDLWGIRKKIVDLSPFISNPLDIAIKVCGLGNINIDHQAFLEDIISEGILNAVHYDKDKIKKLIQTIHDNNDIQPPKQKELIQCLIRGGLLYHVPEDYDGLVRQLKEYYPEEQSEHQSFHQEIFDIKLHHQGRSKPDGYFLPKQVLKIKEALKQKRIPFEENVNQRLWTWEIYEEGENLLTYFAKNNHVKAVEYYLDNTADLTSLLTAIIHNTSGSITTRTTAINELSKDPRYYEILIERAKETPIDELKEKIASGLLFEYIYRNNPPITNAQIDELVALGADLTREFLYVPKVGWPNSTTLLHSAAAWGEKRIVEHLMTLSKQKNVEIPFTDNRNTTAQSFVLKECLNAKHSKAVRQNYQDIAILLAGYYDKFQLEDYSQLIHRIDESKVAQKEIDEFISRLLGETAHKTIQPIDNKNWQIAKIHSISEIKNKINADLMKQVFKLIDYSAIEDKALGEFFHKFIVTDPLCTPTGIQYQCAQLLLESMPQEKRIEIYLNGLLRPFYMIREAALTDHQEQFLEHVRDLCNADCKGEASDALFKESYTSHPLHNSLNLLSFSSHFGIDGLFDKTVGWFEKNAPVLDRDGAEYLLETILVNLLQKNVERAETIYSILNPCFLKLNSHEKSSLFLPTLLRGSPRYEPIEQPELMKLFTWYCEKLNNAEGISRFLTGFLENYKDELSKIVKNSEYNYDQQSAHYNSMLCCIESCAVIAANHFSHPALEDFVKQSKGLLELLSEPSELFKEKEELARQQNKTKLVDFMSLLEVKETLCQVSSAKFARLVSRSQSPETCHYLLENFKLPPELKKLIAPEKPQPKSLFFKSPVNSVSDLAERRALSNEFNANWTQKKVSKSDAETIIAAYDDARKAKTFGWTSSDTTTTLTALKRAGSDEARFMVLNTYMQEKGNESRRLYGIIKDYQPNNPTVRKK